MKTFTTYQNQFQNLAKNNSATTTSVGNQLINDSLRYLTNKFYFNEKSYTFPGGTVSQQQFYNVPPLLDQLINVTISIGSVVWICRPVQDRNHWDALNVITFYQDFPTYFYLYNNQVGIWPIPATTGNPMTINYQIRLTDLSQTDYVQGTVSVTTNTTTVTGAGGASWTTSMAGRWLQIANGNSNTTSGDNNWYQIASVTNSTTLVLTAPYAGTTVSGGTYIIGEVPLLAEDYQDCALYRALWIYFTSRVPNPTNAKLYKELYDEGYERLNSKFGQKTTQVSLTDNQSPYTNPNLFPISINGPY